MANVDWEGIVNIISGAGLLFLVGYRGYKTVRRKWFGDISNEQLHKHIEDKYKQQERLVNNTMNESITQQNDNIVNLINKMNPVYKKKKKKKTKKKRIDELTNTVNNLSRLMQSFYQNNSNQISRSNTMSNLPTTNSLSQNDIPNNNTYIPLRRDDRPTVNELAQRFKQ